MFVLDVVAANLAALASRRAGFVNVGTGEQTSVRRVVEILVDRGGGDGFETAPARPGEVARVSLDGGRASRWLGWRARTAIEDGLGATATWFGVSPRAARSRVTRGARAPADDHSSAAQTGSIRQAIEIQGTGLRMSRVLLQPEEQRQGDRLGGAEGGEQPVPVGAAA